MQKNHCYYIRAKKACENRMIRQLFSSSRDRLSKKVLSYSSTYLSLNLTSQFGIQQKISDLPYVTIRFE